MIDSWWQPGAERHLGCCLLLVACLSASAQGNLVPNASFEEIDECPSYPTMLGFQAASKPTHWEKWLNSPDYFNACVDTMASVPDNVFGHQGAWDGQAYIGMWTYGNFGNEFRELVGVQLDQPLEVGVTYFLSFRVCAAEGTNTPPGSAQPTHWATNNIGLLFTMEHNIWNSFQGPPFPPRNQAHLRSLNVVSDTANWLLVSGMFIADSAYQYVAIGNFFENALTDTVHVTPGSSTGAYVYVDAVCVTTTVDGCSFTSGFEGTETEAGLVLFPNPADQSIEVVWSKRAELPWRVLDLSGRIIMHGELGSEQLRLDVRDWPSGIYIMQVEGVRRSTVRFVVMH